MMQIFGRKTELETLTRRRDRLAGKADAARTELHLATEAQIKIFTESDQDNAKSEAAALRRVELAAASLKGTEAALAQIEGQILDLQKRADEERERLEHNLAADEIERMASAFERTLEPTLSALRAFSKAASELDHLNFEVDAISRYAHVAASELEIASALAITEIRSKATAVRGGESRIPLRAPPPPQAQPAPAITRVWLIQPVAWTQDGQIVIRDMNAWADLSPALARVAIARGAAVLVGDAKAGQAVGSWRQWHAFGAPSLERCVRLDEEAESVSARPEQPRVLHSAHPDFQLLDRGEAYVIKTPAGEAA